MTFSESRRSLLVLNGIGLLISSALSGWLYFFQVLGEIELWIVGRSTGSTTLPSRRFRTHH